MPLRTAWRRYRPRVRLDNNGHELFELVRREINLAVPAVKRVQWHDTRWIDNAIMRLKSKCDQFNPENQDFTQAASWIALVILQAPRAARAQVLMDKHHGGYKERDKRLFELIDFNDAYVSAILSLPEQYLPDYPQRLQSEIDLFCRRLHVKPFTREQYEAITHGLSREIAVYKGAIKEGLRAHMTSRVQDAMGVDMIITDPDSNRSISIDCKTHSSFHFRLIDLSRQGRMTDEQRMYCELAGYCASINGKHQAAVRVVLVRISTDHLGEIEHFQFKDTSKLGILLRSALHDYGR